MITNREWLESLTDKQLAAFLTDGLFVTSAHYLGGVHFPVNIRMTANSYIQSNLGIEKWLSMPQDYEVVEETR